MPKNKLTDLNNHLFEQLERLNDEDLSEEQLARETKRADAMSKLATQIVNNAKTQVDAAKIYLDYGKIEDLQNLPVIGYEKAK